MKRGYTALSPFCRKVRMAMEYKGLAFEVVSADNIAEAPGFNPRGGAGAGRRRRRRVAQKDPRAD